MASQSAKEQFLKQFEQIVQGVKQNKAKVNYWLCFYFTVKVDIFALHKHVGPYSQKRTNFSPGLNLDYTLFI